MPRETQKSKIEHLEKLLEEYRKQYDELQNKTADNQINCDKEFTNSPYKRQLEKDIEVYKSAYNTYKSLLENSRKREEYKDKEIERLQAEIQKLINENSNLVIKNIRGAGRKPKFMEVQIKEIVKLYKKGETISSLAKRYKCSVGLIHKLINENL